MDAYIRQGKLLGQRRRQKSLKFESPWGQELAICSLFLHGFSLGTLIFSQRCALRIGEYVTLN